MEEDYIYERIKLPSHVKLETVTGGTRYKGKVWREIASQIYCENGRDGYRELGHFPSGAPFLYGEDEKISISHTDGCYAVATIKVPADTNLSEFAPDTALGIDVEREDREKVKGLRTRFLSEEELKIVPEDNLRANVTAWTCKEAMLKAGMDKAIDWHHDIVITSLPAQDKDGEGYIRLHGFDNPIYFTLTTLLQDSFIITIARAKKFQERQEG